MRNSIFICTLALCIISPAPLWAADTVRVLVMGEGFRDEPARDAQLTKLDTARGLLVLGDDTSYSGAFEVWQGDQSMFLVNELPLEDYVQGVVKSETGKDWPLEALKAQAVAVRTYALYNKARTSDKLYDLTSSVSSQVFKGQVSDPLIEQAVRETRGEVALYEGKPIAAFYHSTTGGYTELPEEVFGKPFPYLKSVSAGGAMSPLFLWTRTIPLADIETAIGLKGLKSVIITSLTVTGRVKELTFEGATESRTLPSNEVRKLLGWKVLPSTLFSLRPEDGAIIFEGRGWGHGVGLCQWCSLEMAIDGKPYKEILEHFYPGTTVTKLQ